MDKIEKIDFLCLKVAQAVLSSKNGKINISQIVAGSGISRAWVYKYLGADEQEIIHNVVDTIASRFTGVTDEKPDLSSREEWISFFIQGISTTMDEVDQYAEFYTFYLYAQIHNKGYAKRFNRYEELFLKQRFFPIISEGLQVSIDEAQAIGSFLHDLRMGIILNWFKAEDRTQELKEQKLAQLKKYVLGLFI